MKKLTTLIFGVLLLASWQAMAAGIISKQQAEADALNAVNGGTVIQATYDRREHGIAAHWDVDISNPGIKPGYEVEVWVNATTGAIMKEIYSPL